MRDNFKIINLINQGDDPSDEKAWRENAACLEAVGYEVELHYHTPEFETYLATQAPWSCFVWNYGTSVFRRPDVQPPWLLIEQCQQYQAMHPLGLHTLAADKRLTRQVAKSSGIKVPAETAGTVTAWQYEGPFPCVLKPSKHWGSVGVEYAEDLPALTNHIAALAKLDIKDFIIQEFIPGSEFFAATILYPTAPAKYIRPLHLEILSGSPIFTAADKKQQDYSRFNRGQHPDESLNERVFAAAVKVHRNLGSCGMLRSEFKYYRDELYFIETNGKPGMTELSSFSQAYQNTTGETHTQMLEYLIQCSVDYLSAQRGLVEP